MHYKQHIVAMQWLNYKFYIYKQPFKFKVKC
jgi:hypothetical protein